MTKAVLEEVSSLPCCTIVPMDERHSTYIVSWRNDPVNSAWFTSQHRFTVVDHEIWLSRARGSGTDFNWVIEDLDGRPIGTIGLYNVNFSDGHAEIGRILVGFPGARGKGFGKAAFTEILRLAKCSGLEKIYLFVFLDNSVAINLYEAAGFVITNRNGDLIRMERSLD